MYIPKYNDQADVSKLHHHMKQFPFGTWVVPIDGDALINHIPFILHETLGDNGVLAGHVARANDVWQKVAGCKSIVAFVGGQAYITPSWYADKQLHGKVVPTWNYTVVHAEGITEVIEDKNWLLAHVSDLTNLHEKNEAASWSVGDAPPAFIDKLTDAIVGIEIRLTKVTGKWKLGQNRPKSDIERVISGLASRSDPQSMELARQTLQQFHEPYSDE